MMKKYNILFLLAILSVTLSCGDRRGPDAGKRVITVTIEPLRYFTERIAGDRFDVATMVPEGGNPETYEPSARQMVDLSRSVLYVKVGSIGFERTWMKKLEQNAPHAIVVDSSDGISLVKTENGIADPHTWMSTANARIIAGNIYRALVRIDKKDSIYFKKNLDSLVDSINRVDLEVRRLTEKAAHRTFLIYHPALSYFARDYGLRQIPIEAGGKEPSPAYLKELVDVCRKETVHVIFVQPEFDRRNAELIAEQTGARVEPINPLSYDWPQEMLHVARALSLPADTLNQKK